MLNEDSFAKVINVIKVLMDKPTIIHNIPVKTSSQRSGESVFTTFYLIKSIVVVILI